MLDAGNNQVNGLSPREVKNYCGIGANCPNFFRAVMLWKKLRGLFTFLLARRRAHSEAVRFSLPQ
jgi:hypothetical protein